MGGKGSGAPGKRRVQGAGRKAGPYLTKNGILAVKIDPMTRAKIELLAMRRQIAPDMLIAQIVEDERQRELGISKLQIIPASPEP